MGSIHLEAMVRVLGHADLPLVVDTVIEHMRQKVQSEVYSSVQRLLCRTVV